MDLSVSYMSGLSQLLCLTAAIAAGWVAAVTYRHRQRGSTLTMQRNAAPAGKIVYHDAPTVRVVESQRADRVRKLVQASVGGHVDVLETRTGSVPRFRVHLKSIERRQNGDVAHLSVEFGGTRISCGPLVEELGFNEFMVPRMTPDEPRSALFHYRENGNSLNFMRIKVRSLDATAGIVQLDVMQVSEYWPASEEK